MGERERVSWAGEREMVRWGDGTKKREMGRRESEIYGVGRLNLGLVVEGEKKERESGWVVLVWAG